MICYNHGMNHDLKNNIIQLPGPILLLGAGGFIGINLLNTLLNERKDVYCTTHNLKNSWRLIMNNIPSEKIYACDITDFKSLQKILTKLKPRIIFNLAAYGAYSKQQDCLKIYNTNFIAHIRAIEILKKFGFYSYIYAGSSSEYGLNCSTPTEDEKLLPNSHYALSKISVSYSINYYGKVEKLPVVHLRLYSAYGPWEEPDRLIPTILHYGKQKAYPSLAQPHVTRDFIYISDVCSAFITAAKKMNQQLYGEIFNIGTGIKTTIKDIAMLVKKMYKIKNKPEFGSMANRSWDTENWFANNGKATRLLKWKPLIPLEDGLRMTATWQEEVNYERICKYAHQNI